MRCSMQRGWGVLLWHRTLLYEVSRVCKVVDFKVVDVQKRLLACRQRQLRLVEAVVVMRHVPQKSCMHIHQSRNGSHWQPSDVCNSPMAARAWIRDAPSACHAITLDGSSAAACFRALSAAASSCNHPKLCSTARWRTACSFVAAPVYRCMNCQVETDGKLQLRVVRPAQNSTPTDSLGERR